MHGTLIVTEVSSSGKLRSSEQRYTLSPAGKLLLGEALISNDSALSPFPRPAVLSRGGAKKPSHTVAEPISGLPETAPSIPTGQMISRSEGAKSSEKAASFTTGQVELQRPTRSAQPQPSIVVQPAAAASGSALDDGLDMDEGGEYDDYQGSSGAVEDFDDDLDL